MNLFTIWELFSTHKTAPTKKKLRRKRKKLYHKVFPTMYALAKNGNIRTRIVEVRDVGDYAILTTTKLMTLKGKVTKDNYGFYEGVNIGKSNETTYLEQALSQADTIINQLIDKGFTTTLPEEGQKFNVDARGKIKPMLASKFSERAIEFPCLVQPKYDGVRCIITNDIEGVHIYSRQGKPYNIPHIQKWAENNKHLLPLDGELYNHKELTFQEIISAVKRVTELTDKITYVVYDNPIEKISNLVRWKKLQENLKEEEHIKLTETIICNSMKEIEEYHTKCVKKGYEGVMVRNLKGKYEFGFRSRNLIKYKHFDTDEFVIVDVVEATGRDVGTAIFECQVGDETFRTRPQGTRKLRKEYWDNRTNLIGKSVTVQYQGLTDAGKPRFPTALVLRDYE